MALTPDTPNESFLREVDENLRRERMETFAKRYGTWLVMAVVLFLAAVGGYLYWQYRQQEQASQHSEQLSQVYDDIGANKMAAANTELAQLDDAGNSTVRALAGLTEAAVALEKNDRTTALAKYKALAADEHIPDAYRNLALVRSTSLEFDSLKPGEIVSRLEPLSKPGNPWFGTAGELTAMAYLKQNQKDKAGRLFASIAADKTVPDSIRSRSLQIAATLGVDTSKLASIPAQAGTEE